MRQRVARWLMAGVIAVAGGFGAVPDAEAFSSFKGRFGGQHPMCALEPGTQVWPEEDISVVPPRAVSNVICPSATRVNQCKNVRQGQADYAACQTVLSLDAQCRKPPQANLGNRSDKQYWAGVAPYRPWPDRSWNTLKRLGTFDVPVDIEVRVHFVTEADPHYEFVAPGFKIGPEIIHAPPYTGHRSDPRVYWGGWPHDCGSCHNPHRYSRGPINYWFGDNLERGLRPNGGNPRTRDAHVLKAGSHEVYAMTRCYPRDKNGCGTDRVYQQRMRIEFLRCN